ncbi:MAG TPA: adenylate/guanylate cyclase domain-containing protein [Solirubrobacterales bacterium]
MIQRLLSWLYERLGSSYPFAFIVFELQTAWVIAIATLGLFSLYYDAPFDDFVRQAIVVLALTGTAVFWALLRTRSYVRPLTRWIASKDRDDPRLAGDAWATAVGLPQEVVRRDLVVPVGIVALPGSITAVVILHLSPLAFLPLFAGSMIAIGYAGILHYLALESGMRPVLVDINRVMPPRLRTGTRALPLRFKLLAALPMINIITGLVAAALSTTDSGGGSTAGLGLDVLIAIGVAFTISFELSVLLTRSILSPIYDLARGIDAVRQGDFDTAVPVTTADELGELSAGFNQMVRGLAEREKIREAFGTYLDREVADYILSEGFSPEGVDVDVSLLFCDVHDFTSFAEGADAAEVVARLNELFESLVPVVSRHGGHVDKFIGDGLLAVFGAPEPFPDHANRAVRAAVEMARCANHGDLGLLRVGIGVNSGRVVAGSIGGGGRLNFSVIGDPVNVAARVEHETRELDEEVLITDDTRRRLSDSSEVVSVGTRQLRGKSEPTELFAPRAGIIGEEKAETGVRSGGED